MSSLRQRLEVEFDNIEKSLAELPATRSCTGLSRIELAGVAALLHSFYNGVEKALREIFKHHDLEIPSGANWHKELLAVAIKHRVISNATAQQLGMYLAFRHFFVHAYVIDLDPEKLEALLECVDQVFAQVKGDWADFL